MDTRSITFAAAVIFGVVVAGVIFGFALGLIGGAMRIFFDSSVGTAVAFVLVAALVLLVVWGRLRKKV